MNTTVLLPSGDEGLEEIMGQEAPGTGEGNEEQVKGGGGGWGSSQRGSEPRLGRQGICPE